jgi:hypothetical protein
MILVAFIHAGQAQTTYDPAHPVLDYQCPAYPLPSGVPVKLRARILDARLIPREIRKSIVFRWSLSGGKLLSSVNANEVMFDPSDREEIAVTLSLIGAPPEMEIEKTCRIRIERNCARPRLFKRFGTISDIAEKDYLDRFAARLKFAGPHATGFLLSYAGHLSCRYEAQWRADQMKNYLQAKYGLTDNQVIAVDAGVRNTWNIELYLQPNGTCGPQLRPTRRRDDVHVTGPCSER